jgi:hypothetical protein
MSLVLAQRLVANVNDVAVADGDLLEISIGIMMSESLMASQSTAATALRLER